MSELIQRGPLTVILVFTTTCPHCHSYMPIWKQLCKTPGRQANMVSMEAATYDRTPLAEKKPVSGVPTVLFVDTEGKITEADEPRNREAMTAVLRSGSAAAAASAPAPAPAPAPTPTEDMFEPISATAAASETEQRLDAVVPGTEVIKNPLPAMPAMPVQSGGNPWAAFLQAATTAAPAALLLGAYSALPRRRRPTTSSGLPRLSTARRNRRRRRRTSKK